MVVPIRQAENTMRGLNQQCLDNPSTTWYVDNGRGKRARIADHFLRSFRHGNHDRDSANTVLRPKEGGRGDCTHCPAHEFQCAKSDWTSQVQTVTATHSRGGFGQSDCADHDE